MLRLRDKLLWQLRGLLSGLSGRLSCHEFRMFVVEYFEGELPMREAWTFERHLRACPECLTYLTAYGTTMAMAGAAFDYDPEAPVPDDVAEDLITAIVTTARVGRSLSAGGHR